jgi:DNA-directed RNA polymerase subunit RPC12/RpoP
MRTRTDVVFYCWRCGQKVSVPDTMQGKLLPCPNCERLLTVPPGADVPKRIVQLEDAEEIVATEDDMSFDCVHCDYLLIADKRGAGMTLQCPGCGKPIIVPQPKDAPPRRAYDAELLESASSEQE